MEVGDVIAGRYQLRALAGSGGMGSVFRARDLTEDTGPTVAVKLLHDRAPSSVRRFLREGRALAQLQHPAVVRYVDHGVTSDGTPWLALEWLAGTGLDIRLARGPLTAAEVRTLASVVASGLAAAHAQRLVHRDVKPSNLFLVDGDPARPKLLDFGITLPQDLEGDRITATGMAIGTIGYMAPEQVQGSRDVDARADVFALGCVLHECLTGKPVFAGDTALAVCMKTLLQPAPSLSGVAPPQLAALIGAMLAKDAAARPQDGGEVVAWLGRLDDEPEVEPEETPAHLTDREMPVVSLVLVCADRALQTTAFGPTEVVGAPRALDRERLAEIAGRHGAHLEVLGTGAGVIAGWGAGPTGEARRAARCALTIRAEDPDVPLALVTGRGELGGRAPLGQVIDHAVGLAASAGPGDILVDETTHGLLGKAFSSSERLGAFRLLGTGDALPNVVRLGPPLLGRDAELAQLDLVWARVLETETSAAILVTADPGLGKTRLLERWLGKLEDDVPVIRAGGNPLAASSAWALLSAALRGRRGQAALGRFLPGDTDLVPVLDTLAGAGEAREPEGRGDWADRVRRAWLRFLDAEAARGPVVLAIEDLHWGDRPSVELLDAALAQLPHRPVLLLATARPGALMRFPVLEESPRFEHLELAPLADGAALEFVSHALGPRAASVASQLVARAEGNPFVLEELCRAWDVRGTTNLPDTALALVEARLSSLAPEVRRVLRAASIFGQTFEVGGLEILAGDDAGFIEGCLLELVARELLDDRGDGSYAFRHTTARDAAYAMLTPADRTLGHQLAAEWLEARAGAEPAVIAGHYTAAGLEGRAAPWYLLAARHAYDGHDFEATFAHIEQARVSGARKRLQGELALLEAEAHSWTSEYGLAAESLPIAVDLLAKGSASWFRALSLTLGNAIRLQSHHNRRQRAYRLLLKGVPADREAILERIGALAAAAGWCTMAGRFDEAHALLDLIERGGPAIDDPPRWLVADMEKAYGFRAHEAGDLARAGEHWARAAAGYRASNRLRSAISMDTNVGYAMTGTGDLEQGRDALRAAIELADELGITRTAGAARHNLGPVLAALGDLEAAAEVELAAIETFVAHQDRAFESAARCELARIYTEAGKLLDAEAEAQRAIRLAQMSPARHAHGLAALGAIHLASRRLDEAVEAATEARRIHDELGSGDPHAGAMLAWLEPEIRLALGDEAAAIPLLEAACDRLMERAERIEDPEARSRFLARVPDHARLLSTAHRVLA